MFLPKSTTSFLKQLDAGIIEKFKVKYRKKLVRYVLVRISDEQNVYEIANKTSVIQAIEWITGAWKEVSSTYKDICGVLEQPANINGDEDVNEEFNNLFEEISEELQIDGGIVADEYSDFDHEVYTSFPPISSDEVDWRCVSMAACIQEYGAADKIAIEVESSKDNDEDNGDESNIS